jgi:hypothetical protein
MSSTVALTGLLPFVVLLAALLAFPLCFLLLKLYRGSVRKGMRSMGGGQQASRAPAASPRAPASQLRILAAGADSTSDGPEVRTPAYRRAVSGPWRASLVYAVAGLSYAAVMTGGWLLATRDETIVWTKLLILSWTYFWPAVLSVLLVAAYDRSRQAQLLGSYFAVFAVLVAIAVARNPGMGIGSLPLYWAIVNGPPTVLLLTFLLRPIRAVGPLVLAFLIVVAIGSQSLLSIAATNEDLLRAIAQFGFQIGLNATAVFVGMIVVGVLLFALLGWPLLRLLGKRYERKKLSDQSLVMDSLWLLFGVEQSIGLAFEAPPWILTGLVAFIAYKLVSRFGWAWAAASSTGAGSKTLLLLRVFALAKRSEQLFDKLRKHWQYAGSIAMIAGPDLVTTTVEPHEFLDFVGGRLGRQFVRGKEDLDRRVQAIDKAADPDGRYRINEFFCHADTWQMTMERLAETSDAVLMDLRSFSPTNQGCVFELGRLVDGVDLNRVVLLVDDTTDRGFLESTLQRLWQSMSADSPNQSALSPTVRVFGLERQSESALKALLRLVLGRATAPSLVAT